MAGHVVRYDNLWYYRTANGQWWLVTGPLNPGGEVPPGLRTRVTDQALEDILDALFDDVQADRIPASRRDGLVLPIPADAATIAAAVARRPGRADRGR